MIKKTAIEIIKPDFDAALQFGEKFQQKPIERPITTSNQTNEERQAKRSFNAPEGYKRLTINLPESLHKKLKMAAVEQGITATEIIERILNKELA